ncbi:MAG: C1q-like domain-containing protein [Emticicia sp.]|uniref:C1q-like domain-containing protein n=1 Tax=Emticicia sp. TaxID=1930953 RepID=UPI003BA66A02
MKKILFFLFFTQSLIAQVQTLPNSIGIGTGINSSIPLHINKNGEIARFQGASPYVSLYDGLNMNGYLQAIGLRFEIGTKNNYDMDFYTSDTQRMNISGSTGKVTFNNGIQLLGGSLQAAGGNSGTDGMILVSKGSANPPAWENRKVGFDSYLSNGLSIPNNTDVILSGLVERYDFSNNFDNSTGEFTAPSDGLYSFTVKIQYPSSASYNGVPAVIRAYKNFVQREQINKILRVNSGNNYSENLECTFQMALQSNDIVYFTFLQVSGSTLNISGGYNGNRTISGYKVF